MTRTPPFRVPAFEGLLQHLEALLAAGIEPERVIWEPPYSKAEVRLADEQVFEQAMRVLGGSRAGRRPVSDGWELRSADAPVTLTAHKPRQGALDR